MSIDHASPMAEFVPISVTLTAKNARSGLERQIPAIAKQLRLGDEIVLSVAESYDGTWEMACDYARVIDELRVIRCLRAGVPAGRNIAAEASRCPLIATCDSDDLVADDWLDNIRAGLSTHDLVIGQFVLVDDVNPFSRIEDEEPHCPGLDRFNFLPVGMTTSLGFSRAAFDAVGGFDESAQGGEDVDFSWRILEHGYHSRNVSATVYKRQRATANGRFLQHYEYGRVEPYLYLRHRAHGMSRQSLLAAKHIGWLIVNAPWSLISPSRRWTFAGVAGHTCGRLIGSIRYKVLYL